MGYSPWGHKELDMTELLSMQPECACFMSLSAFGEQDLGFRQLEKVNSD